MTINLFRQFLQQFGHKEKGTELDNGGALDPNFLDLIQNLVSDWNNITAPITGTLLFTGGNDHYHQDLPYPSLHSRGFAVDITLDSKYHAQFETLLNNYVAKTPGLYTINEYKNPSGAATAGHFHIQYKGDPKAIPTGSASVNWVYAPPPPVQQVDFPIIDQTFGTTITGQKTDINSLLHLKDGNNAKQNNHGGSQILINSDRLIFNARTNYLMLFGQEGIAISSQGNVNIDADDAVTIYGEDGVFIGVPGKGQSLAEGGGNTKAPSTKADPTIDNDYEPLVLGNKLVNIIEDLLIVIKNATILTPSGKAYFRDDTMYELAAIQSRLPEMLSTYAYIDGLSHESVDPAPTPPTSTAQQPTNTTSTAVTTNTTAQPNAPSNALKNLTDFYNTTNLY
jgi:hypothetical protein